MATLNRQVVLRARPDRIAQAEHFAITATPLPEPSAKALVDSHISRQRIPQQSLCPRKRASRTLKCIERRASWVPAFAGTAA